MVSHDGKKIKRKKLERLDYINVNAAGIDIGSKSHFVAIPEGRDSQTVSGARHCNKWCKWCQALQY